MNGAKLEEPAPGWLASWTRLYLLLRRRMRLNRFLLVIDVKKGVSLSALVVIILDLVDLLWNLSMTFGPLNTLMTTLLLIETLLVVCTSSVLLYAMKSENWAHLMSVLLAWLLVVAVDYVFRVSMIFCTLIISEKASTSAKTVRLLVWVLMLTLGAHCWLCVFTFYDDNNGKITTVKITPSDDRGRALLNKRHLMKAPGADSAATGAAAGSPGFQPSHELAAGKLMQQQQQLAAANNMLRAPTEESNKPRW